jgi:hypothetical protein
VLSHAALAGLFLRFSPLLSRHDDREENGHENRYKNGCENRYKQGRFHGFLLGTVYTKPPGSAELLEDSWLSAWDPIGGSAHGTLRWRNLSSG